MSRVSSFARAAFAFMATAIPLGAAMAEDSVTINGTTYTCTNQCVVTIHSNPWGPSFTVVDSLGGRVSFVIYRPIRPH